MRENTLYSYHKTDTALSNVHVNLRLELHDTHISVHIETRIIAFSL